MSSEIIAKPLNRLAKIRSLDEILTRSGQAISVYREQKRGSSIPTDEEFIRLIDRNYWGKGPVTAKAVREKFYAFGQDHFFTAFQDRRRSTVVFRQTFGEGAAAKFVAAADNIVGGRIDLLGLKSLYVGKEPDWHLEPIASKRSPLKHWKQFDELDTTETGNKKIVWELNRHQHFFTLGVAYWLTGDERFARTFASHLKRWMDENPPGMGVNWSSSLEVAFRSMSWIWAFHFFKDSSHLSPSLFKQAQKFLYLQGRHIEKYLSKYYSPNTHLTGEALGLYYLGTQLPFLGRAKHWRELGENILIEEISRQVLPDGVYFEQSSWYQRYTVDIFTHYILLRGLVGKPVYTGKLAVLEQRLEKAFEFMQHLTQPDGRTPIIGDDDGGRLLPLTMAAPDDFRGSLAAGSLIFERGDLKFVGGPASQEVFWLTGLEGLKTYNALPSTEPPASSASFPDGGYFVMRDGWNDTDNFLAIDCGELGSLSGAHGHADALSIELAIHGKTLLVDSGTFTYHDSRELRDYFRSTSAHNTLTLDGLSASEPGSAFNWKSMAEARNSQWISKDRFDFFEGSHSGYERLGDGAKHTRSILFAKGDYWIMRDLVEGAGRHEYALNFHYSPDAKPVVEDDDRWIGDEDHRLFTFGDNGAWQQKESWISNNHANRVNAPFLRFVSNGEGPQEFFTFILPVDSRVEPPLIEEVPSRSGRAFKIGYAGYTDLFVYNDDVSQTIDNGIFVSNFEYSWARLRAGESTPDEFILINGDRLVIGGKEIFESQDVNSASVRRLGSELYIETDLGRTCMKIY
jgi:hypothetical protein